MKKRLTLLIFTACAVFVGSVGLIFWALAATQVNITSGLLVTYKPTPQVVCNASATYQRTNDASAIAFKDGNLSFGYGGATTDKTMEATTNALQLDDSNTYVVFEFTFVNQNLMENYDLTITLTDNGTVTNMTRKYYFSDLSSSNISAKRNTIKNSGIDNSSLSSQKLVLGYQKTGRIYMLLEITPGTVASYLADNTNKFVFNMTTAEHVEVVETVSYLHPDWANIIYNAPSNASMIYEGETRDSIVGAVLPGVVTYPYETIFFTKEETQIAGLSNSVSVGTNSETSTSAYITSDTISDVTAYWGSDKSTIVIYSPGTIYAPQNCTYLFYGAGDASTQFVCLNSLQLDNFDTSKVTDMKHMFYQCSSLTSLDVSNFDTSNVTDMSYMFYGCSALTSLDLGNFNLESCSDSVDMLLDCSALASITLPYNVMGGHIIFLPGTTYYNGSLGPYDSFIGGPPQPTSARCSTADTKVTLTKQS
ncbi:MAG: BspA family leucine-rich repeat surface protein [Christensenellales bacterium]